MGFISYIKDYFRRDKLTITKLIDLLNQGTSLINISQDLYSIPEIRTCINFVAEKIGSVPFSHVRVDDEGFTTQINDRLNYVLNIRTNPYQCPQIFWTYCATRLLLSNNCFIMPEWDTTNGNLIWLWPLPFTSFDFTQTPDNRIIITFTSNGNYQFYLDDIIHLQRYPTGKHGARRQATGNYVEIVNTMENQAVEDSKNNGRIAAIMQVRSNLKGPEMKKKLDEFKELFLNSENTTGFGMIGADYDIHKLDLKLNPLDTVLLDNITSRIYNYFGISKEIINGTASELQYQQFVNNTIKPIIWQIEEELTYKLFSTNEINHFNRIQSDMLDLEVATLAAKTAFYKEMIYGTVLTRNEVRKDLGKPKGPPELDKFLENKNFQVLQAGNYVVEGGDTGGDTSGQGADTQTAT